MRLEFRSEYPFKELNLFARFEKKKTIIDAIVICNKTMCIIYTSFFD